MTKQNKLPNELVVQLDGKSWYNMTTEEKIKEIDFAIWRCEDLISDIADDLDWMLAKRSDYSDYSNEDITSAMLSISLRSSFAICELRIRNRDFS